MKVIDNEHDFVGRLAINELKFCHRCATSGGFPQTIIDRLQPLLLRSVRRAGYEGQEACVVG